MADNEPIDEVFQYIVPAGQTGVMQRCKRFPVPFGAMVRVRAHNGAAAGNTAPMKVGAEQLNEILAPNTETQRAVRDLIHIVFEGAAGDGIVVSVKGQG